jgi:hypothetical protein
MAMECLLTATVIRGAKQVAPGRHSVSVRFTDCLGNFAYAECSSTYKPTVDRLNKLSLGDPVAVRGHVAVVPGNKETRLGSLKVSITGLMTLGNGEME